MTILSEIQFECEEYLGIFCGISSVPRNHVMNLNNVMSGGALSAFYKRVQYNIGGIKFI